MDYWIEKGCSPEKMTLGFGAYGRAFRGTGMVHGGTPKRLEPGNSVGVQGPYTKEDGYVAYFEVCNWDDRNRDLRPDKQVASGP